MKNTIILSLFIGIISSGCCNFYCNNCADCRKEPPSTCIQDSVQIRVDLSSLELKCTNGSNCMAVFTCREDLLKHSLASGQSTGLSLSFCGDDPLYTAIDLISDCQISNLAQCSEPPRCRTCLSLNSPVEKKIVSPFPLEYADFNIHHDQGTPGSHELVVLDCENDSIIPSDTSGFLTLSIIRLGDHVINSYLASKVSGVTSTNAVYDSVENHYKKRWVQGLDNLPGGGQNACETIISNINFRKGIRFFNSEGETHGDPLDSGTLPKFPSFSCLSFPEGTRHFTIYNCATKIFVTVVKTEIPGTFLRLGYNDCKMVEKHVDLSSI